MKIKDLKVLMEAYSDDSLAITFINSLINYHLNDGELILTNDTLQTKLKHRLYKIDSDKRILGTQLKQTNMYLKGEMYKDEDTARNMLSKQIQNIEEALKYE
jgi:hypothetical protein